MSNGYQGEGFYIDCQQRYVRFEDKQVEIRPKTLALILALIESEQQISSKADLLNQVWDDVCCDEQVLFQTISEIRRLFAPHKVIQTHPRKGYTWIAKVAPVSDSPARNNVLADSPSQTTSVHRQTSLVSSLTKPFNEQRFFRTAVASLLLVALAVVMIYWLQVQMNRSSPLTNGTVLVLPIDNQVPGEDHRWVPLGAMEQLIGKLNHRGKVMDISYVLNLRDSLQLADGFGLQSMLPVFNRSGADVVVETQLSGTTRQYQLGYKLHLRQDIKKGVIFSASVDDGLNQLAQRIKPYIDDGQSALRLDYQSELNHALVFEAVALYGNDQHAAAQQLLSSLIALEPANVRIHLLSAQWFVEQQQFQLAQQQVEHALAQNQGGELQGQLYYWLARSYQFQDIALALSALDTSIAASAEVNDLLFSAYGYELQGILQQQQQQYRASETSLLSALKFHQQIFCPMGTSTVKLMLASLYLQQGDVNKSRQYLQAASQQIQQQSLPITIPKSLGRRNHHD
ncbi:transcriptional regulator [Shewanella waksmanii]|uniref:winged helix-turn-helix domain-containing protein n=1 Tax=Shewanella waksmanii TaxID=213783 RepID=UPI00373678D0